MIKKIKKLFEPVYYLNIYIENKCIFWNKMFRIIVTSLFVHELKRQFSLRVNI